MGVPRKPVLEGACYQISNAGEGMARAGDGFQVVPDIAGGRVEFDQEALFALLNMHSGGGVDESEAGCGVDSLRDPAETQRPQSQGLDLDGNDLAGFNERLGIGDAGPAEIKGRPLREGSFSRGKCGLALIEALANSRAGAVMDKAEWELRRDETVGDGQELRSVGGEELRGSNLVFDCCRAGLGQGEHGFSMPVQPAGSVCQVKGQALAVVGNRRGNAVVFGVEAGLDGIFAEFGS